MLHNADARLYLAKRQGRNRVCGGQAGISVLPGNAAVEAEFAADILQMEKA